jgi:hypothetical protein
MGDSAGYGGNGYNEPGRRVPNRGEPHLRAFGAQLPTELRDPYPLPAASDNVQRLRNAPQPPERALARTPPPAERPSGLQRAASALRAALPYVQRILPLLDGNIGTAVSNVLSPYPQMPPPPPPVNLEPLEDSLAELQMQHRALRNQFLEQNTALKRIEDQLETLRETVERNAREQEELLDSIEAVRGRMNRFAILGLALLALSVLANVALYLHIEHILF